MALNGIEVFINPKFKFSNRDQFAANANAIAWMYYNKLKHVPTKYLNKITIELSPILTENRIIDYGKELAVCVIQIPYKFDCYFSLNEIDKKVELLNVLQNSMELAASKFSWSLAPFQEAYKSILKNGFVNVFYICKAISSPSRKSSAQIGVDASIEFATIFAIITDIATNGEKRIEIIKVLPSIEYVREIFRSLKWINDSELLLSGPNEEINFKVNCTESTSELLLIPKMHTLIYLKDTLKIVNPIVDKEEKLKILHERIISGSDGVRD